MPLTQLQVKLRKIPEMTFSEGKKQKTGFKKRKNVRLMFRRAKDSAKDKCYLFTGYKKRKNICLLYFQRKLRQDR